MNKTYIIAEIGPNHNGSIELAMEMVEKLAKIGVDAVKFQISIPENLHSDASFLVDYQKRSKATKTPFEMSRKYGLSFEEHRQLYDKCSELNIDYLCSAFELESLKFINENFDLEYFKIPSGEICSLDTIEYIAAQNKPVILSTGMSTYDEIKLAIGLINKNFKKEIIILHCISNYPTPPQDVNLNVMLELKRRFDYQVGFSDHTEGNDAAIAAVALGAKLIEKHVTTDKGLPGPDHKASVTIEEFSNLVKSIRNVEIMLGEKQKKFSETELKIKAAVRKSIVAKKDLQKGHIIKDKDLSYKRPGFGISPIDKNSVIGKKVTTFIKENTLIKKEQLED